MQTMTAPPPEVADHVVPADQPLPATSGPANQLPALADSVQAINDARVRSKQKVVQRDVVLDLLWLCIVARQHLQLYGSPGVAKSLLTRVVLALFGDDVSGFEILMRKDLPTELLVGPLSLKALENDEIRHITAGTIVDALIAFLDENYKANAVALNTLLTILNERRYHNGRQIMRVPLWTAVGASNEGPQEEGLAPFEDRFAGRYMVEEVTDEGSFLDVLDGQLARAVQGDQPEPNRVQRVQMEVAQAAVPHVQVPIDLRKQLHKLWEKARGEGLQPSLRRVYAGVTLAQANAVLNGRQAVTITDLRVFEHVLWSDIEDRVVAGQLCANFKSPVDQALNALSDQFVEIRDVGYPKRAPAVLSVKDLEALIANKANLPREDVGKMYTDSGPVQGELSFLGDQVQKEIAKYESTGADVSGLKALHQTIDATKQKLSKGLLG